jgi:hypothetical protein
MRGRLSLGGKPCQTAANAASRTAYVGTEFGESTMPDHAMASNIAGEQMRRLF